LRGALYAMMFGFVDPESGLGILISVKMLIMGSTGRRRPVVSGPWWAPRSWCRWRKSPTALLGGKGAGPEPSSCMARSSS